jgi:hypothetical protein
VHTQKSARITSTWFCLFVIAPDETGWRVGGEGAWLWVAATRGATAYWVADGRSFDQRAR